MARAIAALSSMLAGWEAGERPRRSGRLLRVYSRMSLKSFVFAGMCSFTSSSPTGWAELVESTS